MAIIFNKKKPETPEPPPTPTGKIVIKSKIDVAGIPLASVKHTKYYRTLIEKEPLVRDKVKVTLSDGTAFIGNICGMGSDTRPATRLKNFDFTSMDVITAGGKKHMDIYPDTDKVEVLD